MSSSHLPKCVPPDGGRRVNVMGNELRVVLSGADTGGTMELVELIAAPGVGIPPHVHTCEEETFLILEGEVEFFVDGKTTVLGPGTTLFGPRDVPHGYKVVGDRPCRMVFTVTPATMEPMFDELAAIDPPDPEKIGSVCDSYGIRFLPG